jgi:hypothetical protein
VNWLRRIGRSPSPGPPAAAEPRPEYLEGAAPGVAALLQGVSEDRTHAVLDLGPATDQSLRVYSRFARWVRFADLLGETWRPSAQGPVGGALGTPVGGSEAVSGLLTTVVARSERPYDLVFAWDILDRLFPEDRPRLIEWLAEVAAPDVRLHLVVRASEDAMMHPLRFALLDVDRIRYEPTGTARLPPSRLLPADVGRLLAPLQVAHAFTLKSGFREYVAVRK